MAMSHLTIKVHQMFLVVNDWLENRILLRKIISEMDYFKIYAELCQADVSTFRKLSLVVRKPVLGVSDQVRHKPGCTATNDG